MTAIITNFRRCPANIDAGSRWNDICLIFLALFWPVAGAIAAFFMLHRRIACFVLGGVMVLIGYRLALVDKRFDAYRLGEFVKEIAALDVNEFSLWVSQYCFRSEQCIDPIQPYYTFLLTRVSGEPHFAFAGYALLFAIFSISVLAAIRRDKTPGSNLFFYFFLFAFMVANPIHHIGGFRFNTASWIFLLGSYLVFYRGRDVGFTFLILAVAFHYAMSVLLALALVLRFFRFPIRVAIMLALASFAVSNMAPLVASLLNLDYQLGALFRAARYVSEGALEARTAALQKANSGSNLFFFFYARTGIELALAIWMTYLLIIKKRFDRVGPSETRLLSYSLTLFAFANAFGDIPSFSRYSVLSIQLLYSSIIVFGALHSPLEKRTILVLFIPSVLFSMLVTLRTGFGLVDFYSVMFSPFLMFSREPIM